MQNHINLQSRSDAVLFFNITFFLYSPLIIALHLLTFFGVRNVSLMCIHEAINKTGNELN